MAGKTEAVVAVSLTLDAELPPTSPPLAPPLSPPLVPLAFFVSPGTQS